MTKQLLLALAMLCFFQKGISQDTLFKPLYRVIITKAPERISQCSRAVPQKIKSFWMPSQTDAEDLESHFNNIYSLRSKDGGIIGAKLESLNRYAFQYLGVIINDEKYIYINAFSNDLLELYKRYNNDLSHELVRVCDGGMSFWGALYNVRTKQFSDLAFNGFG